MKKIIISIFVVGLFNATVLYANKAQENLTNNPQNSVALSAPLKAKSMLPVEINHATAEEFMTLKGIGVKKAGDIIAYRSANGPFKSIEDLAKIKGIGKKALAKLQLNNPNRIVLK